MSIKSTAINSFAKFIIGGSVFEIIKGVVRIQQSKEKSGHEKRVDSIILLKKCAGDISEWIINLGIELAVAMIKELDHDRET